MVEINSMQANLGLIPDSSTPVGYQTPSAGSTAVQLMQQASQRQVSSQQALMSSSVGEQFRQQFVGIQAQQSMNPYGAQIAAQYAGARSYNQGYMPSPLMMTPPSTGVFRPPAPQPISPISPMYRPPIPMTPFTPRMPEPMFQTAYEQQSRLQDMRDNQMFSYASQAPSALAQGAGLAAGAYAGARFGAQFGRYGRMIGAAGGAALAGFSGISRGLGNLADMAMQPMRETREMGAGIQNMTKSWVVSGPQLHRMGRGLSRDSSIEMAEQIRDLSGQDSFQKQTGDMFNRQDLMQIMGQGGRAGLFDMAQSVPQIKQQLRETAVTIKQFMELTNNPDVSSVIRDMGRLRQFGLSTQEMVQAAQGMRGYARAAGTSIGGIQEMGGLPGAMTFQQAGLTAGTGFQYGNYAAASARQLVASGGISSRQLALMGGVQGIAQRDIQAQAAFSSMPMFAAMNAQYGPQGWGVNQRNLGQGGQGAFGMVQQSLQALNQGVRQGGLGALATFPLMQRQIADEATAQMTPEQLMAQRFQMAMQTGKRLGLRGEGAFAAGARTMFGDEVAEQMLMQAKSPGFIRGQRQQLDIRRRELAMEHRRRVEEEAPFMGGAIGDVGRAIDRATGIGRTARAAAGVLGDIGEEFTSANRSVFGRAWDSFQDREALRTQGVYRRRMDAGTAAAARGLRKAGKGAIKDLVSGAGEFSGAKAGVAISDAALVNAENLETEGGLKWGASVADAVIGTPLRLLGDIAGLEPDVGAAVAGASAALSTAGMDRADKSRMVGSYIRKVSDTLETIDRAKVVGGKVENVTSAAKSIDQAMGGGKREGLNILRAAGDKLDKLVYDRGKYGEALTDDDYKKILKETIVQKGDVSSSEADKMVASLMSRPEVKAEVKTQMTHYAKQEPRDSSIWLKTHEQDARTAMYDQLSQQSDKRVEAVKQQQAATEKKLGVGESEVAKYSVLDVSLEDLSFGLIGGYSEEEIQVQETAAEMGGTKFAATAAGLRAFTGDKDDRDSAQWEALVKEKGWTYEEEQAEMKRIQEFARKNEDVAGRMREMAGKGTIEDLQSYATGVGVRGLQAAFTSQGFVEGIGKYSAGLEEYLATAEGPITAEGVAKQFTSKELETMAKSGGQQGRDMAALIKDAKEGDEEAQQMLTQYAQDQLKVTEEGTEEVATTKGEGKEAQRLETSEKALEGMAAMLKDFSPAAKEFKEATSMFRDAMEAGQIISSRD